MTLIFDHIESANHLIDKSTIDNSYPTVVIVTKAHQKPSQKPLMNGFGKFVGFHNLS